ncbi:ferredoxin [Streptacidiphilus sp. MAP12-33]|uniref:ferredoxin n=1 Tax=Streptacidiphilus sp. MAP12-33 TaxID=3156266 RepID=UPI003519C044
MRVSVDTESCIGAGQCAMVLPEVFDQDDTDGLVVLLDEAPPTELHGAVHEALSRCPVQAITATES